MKEFEISFEELRITPQEVYTYMGVGSGTPDTEITDLVKEALREVASLTRPRFAYFLTEGTLQKETITLGSTSFNIGKIIEKQLRNSEVFALFTATAGKEFNDWMEEGKQKDDILIAYIADSLGSCLAEKTADYLEGMLQEEISGKGWKHTNRFSPGYCDWHVSEQQKLFSLFPTPSPCGIQLTPSSLMIPIKSVSGIIGVGTQVKKLEYSCGLCTSEQCYKKRR